MELSHENGEKNVVSVLVIDANATFLRIVTRLLQDYYQAEIRVVGTAEGLADALQQAQQTHLDIILLGLSQHSLEGLRFIPRLRDVVPHVGIVVLGALDIHAYQQAALDAGADAFIAKVALTKDLLPAIQRTTRSATQPPYKREISGPDQETDMAKPGE